MIQVDGGIDARTARDVAAAGATVLVAGNFILTSPSRADAVRTLRDSAAEGIRVTRPRPACADLISSLLTYANFSRTGLDIRPTLPYILK